MATRKQSRTTGVVENLAVIKADNADVCIRKDAIRVILPNKMFEIDRKTGAVEEFSRAS